VDRIYVKEFPTILESNDQINETKKRNKLAKTRTSKNSQVKKCTTSNDVNMKTSDVLVLGTSHVRGLGLSLNRRKINATALCNPGCQIPHISRRIPYMIPTNFKGSLILQVGGNDCSEYNAETVINRYEALLFLIQEHAPMSKIYISQIPQRYGCQYASYKIKTVNNFLHHLSLFEQNIFFISHPHLDSDENLKRDGVHLTQCAFDLYVTNIADSLQDFRVSPYLNMGT
jgi:hypothetical protein